MGIESKFWDFSSLDTEKLKKCILDEIGGTLDEQAVEIAALALDGKPWIVLQGAAVQPQDAHPLVELYSAEFEIRSNRVRLEVMLQQYITAHQAGDRPDGKLDDLGRLRMASLRQVLVKTIEQIDAIPPG